jgi:GxxExxY protein
MKVHRTLGKGFEEKIYQRALALELFESGIEFRREVEMLIYYNGKVIGKKRVDFLAERDVVVELKSCSNLDDTHLAQTMCYCQVQNVPFGLLINFGAPHLQYKKVFNTHHPANNLRSS